MRDTYIFILFTMFIGSGTFLAYTGKVEPQLVLAPIMTGFLGLLAKAGTSSSSSPTLGLPPYGVPSLAQRLGFSKPPPGENKENKE